MVQQVPKCGWQLCGEVMQFCVLLFHIIKFCSLFCIFLTSQSEVDFGIALLRISVASVTQHARCGPSAVQHLSSKSHKWHNFWEKVIECQMCVLEFSTTFV